MRPADVAAATSPANGRRDAAWSDSGRISTPAGHFGNTLREKQPWVWALAKSKHPYWLRTMDDPVDPRRTFGTKSIPPDILAPERRLAYDHSAFDRLTHYVFKYPAKFHPPIVKELVRRYTDRGDWILDPFCGSGTTLVEAAVAGRHVAGSDLDPVATFVSRTKTHRYNNDQLRRQASRLAGDLLKLRRSDTEYEDRRFNDITMTEFGDAVARERLWVPAIPNLFHWFRKYVVLDLARILSILRRASMSRTHSDLFLLCFASIIRASSNADPVPVSGLEVTSYMKKKESLGRTINPFLLLERRMRSTIAAVAAYGAKVDPASKVVIRRVSVFDLASRFRRSFDSIITSPPYHNAVDYYRRHQLEMYWLGFTETHTDRLVLKQHYLGRPKVPQKDPILGLRVGLRGLAGQWDRKFRETSPQRANAFKHYVLSMDLAFEQFARRLKRGKHAIVVVGQSGWQGSEIPTVDLFVEIAAEYFRLVDHAWYPLRNRYMTYQRRNGASIDREHVLVMQARDPSVAGTLDGGSSVYVGSTSFTRLSSHHHAAK